MTENRPIGPGDMVRVRGTPATLAADLAGLIGEVQGATPVSASQIEVIGKLQEDPAIKVHFQDRNEAFWLAPSLLELVHDEVAPNAATDSESVPSRRVRFFNRVRRFLKKKGEDLKRQGDKD